MSINQLPIGILIINAMSGKIKDVGYQKLSVHVMY